MPQTRFVLKHAIACGLSIMMVINKIDREGAHPEDVVNDALNLMMDLGATDEQLVSELQKRGYTGNLIRKTSFIL